MTLMNVAGLELSFGAQNIFGDVSFLIDERDHVGLVGVNGSGKTSMFKVLTGEYVPDCGTCGKSKLTRVGYVEQFAISSSRTVLEELLTVFDDLKEIDRRLSEISALLSKNEGDIDALIEEQHRLTEEYNDRGGLTYPAKVGKLISGSSAFSKFSLNIWKFTVRVLLKPALENFEYYVTSM